MKWASAISQQVRLESALKECAEGVRTQLGEAPVDFAALFVSDNFAGRYEEAHALLADRLAVKTLIGASGGGVIGDGQEVEHRPAVSLVAARLPKVRVRPFSVQDEDLPDLDASPRAWESIVGVRAGEDPQFLVLAATQGFAFVCDGNNADD
ncbi:MAG TPA: FIST N-terminal domain-containing protein, partial [Elusimicrobiota bacterium]|nr:FIST N-terminal domain-containing protein [Elusimicrobiota bacterium]